MAFTSSMAKSQPALIVRLRPLSFWPVLGFTWLNRPHLNMTMQGLRKPGHKSPSCCDHATATLTCRLSSCGNKAWLNKVLLQITWLEASDSKVVLGPGLQRLPEACPQGSRRRGRCF